MPNESENEFLALAAQAEDMGQQAPDQHLAASWDQLAVGFRNLARLYAGFARRVRLSDISERIETYTNRR